MRVFVGCLGFNRPEMIEGALENFRDTVDPSHYIIKTLFNCNYPIPNAQENSARLFELARKYGWWNPTIPNLGVMENWNQAIHEHFHMGEGDYLVTWDPDVRMQQKGWLPAMVEALQSDPETVYVCAARPFHDEEWCARDHGRTIHTLPSGLRVSRYKCLIAWSVGMFKGEFLASRPRDFKAAAPYYAWAEHADFDRMNKMKKTWCQVTDFYDHHQGSEDLYTRWKIESAQAKTLLPFEQWLTK